MFSKHHDFLFAIYACVLVAGAAYLYFAGDAVSAAQPDGPYVQISDTYTGGMHSVEGTVPVNASCNSIVSDGKVNDDTLVLFFAPQPLPGSGGVCSPDTKELPFSMQVEGPEAHYYVADVAGTIYPVRLSSHE